MTGARRPAVLATAGLVLAVLASGCGPDVRQVRIEAVPSPSVSSTSPTPDATPGPTTSPSPTPTDDPSPTETGPREPTDADRADFVASYAPENASGLENVAVDLDGDEAKELVFTAVRGGQVAHVAVAWWTGTAYEVVFSDDGGAATRVDRVRTSDVNADGRTEIVLHASGDDGTASVALWAVGAPREVVRLPASGGCHDGSHVYGVVGASLEDRDGDGSAEIYATCDGSSLDGRGEVDRYRWETGAYRHAPDLLP